MSADWRPAWLRYKLGELRGRSNDALTELDRLGAMPGYLARFMRHLVDAVSDSAGVVWCGAAALAERMHLTERRVRQLIAEAIAGYWLQRTWTGGGRHRTSRYALKVGAWRDDAADAHPSATFAERARVGNAAGDRWLYQLFCDHLALGRACCRQFAPRELKNPEIDWHPV